MNPITQEKVDAFNVELKALCEAHKLTIGAQVMVSPIPEPEPVVDEAPAERVAVEPTKSEEVAEEENEEK